MNRFAQALRSSFRRAVEARFAGYIGIFLLTLAASTRTQAANGDDEVITREELATYFKVKTKLEKNSKESIEGMDVVAGESKRRYRLADVKTYEKFEAQAASRQTLEQLRQSSGYQGPTIFPWIAIRRSYDDVLADEDPSLRISPDHEDAKSFDDLKGALISYAHDYRAPSDTWAAELALIAPFSWRTGWIDEADKSLGLVRYGFAPSFSYHRVTTNGDPKDEVDTETYRLGTFLQFRSGYRGLNVLTFRAFGTYAEDRHQDDSILGTEFELEPRCDFTNRIRIGYRSVLAWKADEDSPTGQSPRFAYQLRLLLHGQYGSVRKEGPAFAGQEYEFFRLGPKTSLDLDPVVFDQLHASVAYEYQPALYGRNRYDHLLSASVTWDLLKKDRQRLGLTVDFTSGGLEFTEQPVRVLKFSLSAAF